MAIRFRGLFIVFTVIAATIPAMADTDVFVVGDKKGWTTGFDYQAWTRGKNFRVGDKLVFRYPAGAHNVMKVNGTGFEKCIVSSVNEALSSGNDEIVLGTVGRKWYICGVSRHCEVGGQKLAITVQPQSAPKLAPSSFQARLVKLNYILYSTQD